MPPRKNVVEGSSEAARNSQRKTEPILIPALLVALAVGFVHLLPLCRFFGVSSFCEHFWENTALAFCFASAFTLTIRVSFLENQLIQDYLTQLTAGRIIAIQAIGACLALAWIAPLYTAAHGVAEMSVAAIGVAVSILTSSIVKNEFSRTSFHDVAPAITILFGILWSRFFLHDVMHSNELVMAVTVGASSVHGWATVVDYSARAFALKRSVNAPTN